MIARPADVPLGSMTYHFASFDELLVEAFTRHADAMADTFDERLGAANNREEAIEAVVSLIWDNMISGGSDRDLILAVERYGAAARNHALKAVTQGVDGPQPARAGTALRSDDRPRARRLSFKASRCTAPCPPIR